MTSHRRRSVGLVVVFISIFSIAYAQNQESTLTIAERVTLLERELAALQTRTGVQSTVGAGSLGSSEAGLAASSRIDRLEREVASLAGEVGRLARAADAAARDAAEARREARAAEMTARDALSRAR